MFNNLDPSKKTAILETLFFNEYEELIEIDTLTGTGTTYYAVDPLWKRTNHIRYDFEEMIQRYVLESCTNPDPNDMIETMALSRIEDRLKTISSYIIHLNTQKHDGTIGIKELGFFRLDETHVLMSIRDITSAFQDAANDVQQLENALNKARDEIHEKNKFLNLMSRNVRTPLHSILGLTRLAKDKFSDGTAFDDYLYKISMSGTYMSETIDDILDLRRIARSDMTLTPEVIDLKEFFLNINHMMQPLIYDKGLLFTMDVRDTANLSVLADRHCLQQVILKLLQSTINYTVKGGRILLSVHQKFLSAKNVTLLCEVDCKGFVIDPQRLELLRQPYDVLREMIDEDADSLDMDLIILKSYLKQLGSNTIAADSNEAGGTRISVTITLPLPEDRTAILSRNADEGSAGPDYSSLRVLLADDNEINLEIGEKILHSRGVDVVSVQNGKQAIEVFQKEKGNFDVLLLDIVMPEMDGLETTRRIRRMFEIPNAASIPIIAMTANAFQENFEESFRAGMNAHLVKPIDPEHLFKTIEEVLQNTSVPKRLSTGMK